MRSVFISLFFMFTFSTLAKADQFKLVCSCQMNKYAYSIRKTVSSDSLNYRFNMTSLEGYLEQSECLDEIAQDPHCGKTYERSELSKINIFTCKILGDSIALISYKLNPQLKIFVPTVWVKGFLTIQDCMTFVAK